MFLPIALDAYRAGQIKKHIHIEGCLAKAMFNVDVASFTKTKEIPVKLNPYTVCFTGDDGKVYVVSNGNYAGSPGMSEDQYIYGTLQCIDPATDMVKDVCKASFVANHGNKMYVLYSEYYLPELKRAFVLDLQTGEETGFIDLDDFSSPNAIGVNELHRAGI